MSHPTTDDLKTLTETLTTDDQLEIGIRVGEATDTITLDVKHVNDDRGQVSLTLPGDDVRYAKIRATPMRSKPGQTDLVLITAVEDQHNADVTALEVA